MAFESYKGGLAIGAGFEPSGEGGFPLMQACDIQVDEDGTTLEQYIASLGNINKFTYDSDSGTLYIITSGAEMLKE